MQGISLASLVAPDVGHITQICVAPAIQGMGVGYELLRRCLDGLRRHGCRKTSLTVTSANLHAIQLYERMGFSQVHQFAAYVWDGL
jgi:ribosomal protein S18 acetylase RimI-like enzyme